MSHTNSTTNYSLPQFVTTDKPAWLTDVNNAYAAIDTGMHNAQTKANTADSNATQALSDASDAATAAAAADAKGTGALASIADTFDSTTVYSVGEHVIYNSLLYVCSVAIVTPGPWTGSTNWTRTTIETMINTLNTTMLNNTIYGVGDSINLRLKTLAGIISGSQKTLQFFIPTAKLIDTNTVNGCSFTGTTFRIYDGSGSESINISDASWSYQIRTDGVAVTGTFSSALTSNNGITVYFGSTTTLTLTA